MAEKVGYLLGLVCPVVCVWVWVKEVDIGMQKEENSAVDLV